MCTKLYVMQMNEGATILQCIKQIQTVDTQIIDNLRDRGNCMIRNGSWISSVISIKAESPELGYPRSYTWGPRIATRQNDAQAKSEQDGGSSASGGNPELWSGRSEL